MKIIKINEGEKKIGLSIRAVKQDEFQRTSRPTASRRPRGERRALDTTLGDAFRARPRRREDDGRGRVGSLGRRSVDMTKAELVDEVSKVSDLTRKHSEVIVDAVFTSIIDALQQGDKIELRGFGSFRIRRRDSRTGRNPKTGAGVVVPAKQRAALQAREGAPGADQPALGASGSPCRRPST